MDSCKQAEPINLNLLPRIRYLSIPALSAPEKAAFASVLNTSGRRRKSRPEQISVDLHVLVDDIVLGEEFSEESAELLRALFARLTSYPGTTGAFLSRQLSLVREAAVYFAATRLNRGSAQRSSALDMAVSINSSGEVIFYFLLSKDSWSLQRNREDVGRDAPSNCIVKLGPFHAHSLCAVNEIV